MSKIHTNHSGVAFELVSVRSWCDYLNGTSTEVSALKNFIFQCSVLGKKIKDWQQDICEKCRCRRHFTVSSRVCCTYFAETNQTWNYFLTWSFRGNATFSWKDWRRKENEADWRWQHFSSEECGSDSTLSFSFTIVTWLILPVVICLSQRLSHACLSINNFVLWNCEWLIKSVIVYLIITYYLDNRGNSRANTC